MSKEPKYVPTCQDGIDAFDRGNYQEAIAILSGLEGDSSNLRGRMWLVMAYAKVGEWDKASQVCHLLSYVPEGNVQKWSKLALHEIERESTRFPVVPHLDFSGWVGLDEVGALSGSEELNDELTVLPPEKEELLLSDDELIVSDSYVWRKAGRIEQRNRLAQLKPFKLWGVSVVSAIALAGTICWMLEVGMRLINNFLLMIPYGQPIQAFYGDQLWNVIWGMGIIALLSGWILDWWFKWFYGMESLPISVLSQKSLESARVIRRVCAEKKIPFPLLKVIPGETGVMFSYGNSAYSSRIVISQGLLEVLDGDEIASLYAAEMGHIIYNSMIGVGLGLGCFLVALGWGWLGKTDLYDVFIWLGVLCLPLGASLSLMSMGVVILQIPFLGYWLLSDAVNASLKLVGGGWVKSVIWMVGGGLVSLLYVVYGGWRFALLWLAKIRLFYGDRVSVDLTGNPNGLARSLLKITRGMALEVRRANQTSPLLQSLDFVMPVGFIQAICLGSVDRSFEELLSWDCVNPYSRLLNLNNDHSLLGDRLRYLMLYARYWKLETELDYYPKVGNFNNSDAMEFKVSRMLLQGAPFYGILFGFLFGLFFLFIGWGLSGMGFEAFSWIKVDFWVYLVALLLIGFALGSIIRFNYYFPSKNCREVNNLADLLTNSAAIPIDSDYIMLKGKLIGRSGVRNFLGQDLMLDTESGLIKLHYESVVGFLGNFWLLNHPIQLLNREVKVLGWFRRGATPWVDVEVILGSGGYNIYSYHRVWSTMLVVVATVFAVYRIVFG